VYAFYCDRTLSFMLRDAAHTFTTEASTTCSDASPTPGVADQDRGAHPRPSDPLREKLAFNDRMGQLVFCRWSLVMAHFERSLYEIRIRI